MLKRTLLFLICISIWASPGRSLQGGSNPGVSFNTVNLPPTQSWRVELEVHTGGSISLPYAAMNDWLDDNGTGVQLDSLGSNLIRVRDPRDGGAPLCTATLSANSLIRIQRIVSTLIFAVEVWNIDGSNYQSCSVAFTSRAWPFSGGGTASNMPFNLAFYRIFLSTVPLNSTRPTTADGSSYTELKFDDDLSDSSRSGHTASVVGTAAFINTPGLGAYATVKTLGAPFWTNWTSFRAGYQNQLDGSGSISMTPASSSVTFFWQALGCPTTPSWSSRTASQPIVYGLIFGTCTFEVTVTDAAGNASNQTLAVGTVATDNNNIVIDKNQSFSDAVFGQQIAFGKNPWPYSDWANLNAVNVVGAQLGAPNSGMLISADWNTPLGTGSDTCSITGAVLTCTAGINLQTAFCGGGTAWTGGNTNWLIAWYHDPNNAGRVGRLPLQPLTCPTPTTMTLDYSSYVWVYAGTSCTVAVPCTFAASRNWLGLISTAGSFGYYDGATMFNAFHRRSGLDQANTWALNLASLEVTGPGIDEGVNVAVQSRINPSRQWAVQQVYNPGSAFAANFQRGLRNFATHFGYIFSPPGYEFSPFNQIVNGVNVNCNPYCVTDVRENGAALMDVAAAAYIETDPTWKATLNAILENSWTNFWGVQLQSDGHWDQSMGGAAGSPPANFTNGSATVTANGSHTFPTTQCGTLFTNTGHVNITNGGTTINGIGTTFTAGASATFIVVYGKFSGVYGKQIFNVVSIINDTTLTVAQPIYLDSATGLNFQMNSFPMFVVVKTNTSGATVPFTPDSAWYTCTYVDATHLTLDQPFQIASEIGFMVYNGSDAYTVNQGTQPYMNAFPAAGYELGALVGTPHAPQMRAAARGLYPFLSTTAWAATAKGAYFATGFGDCMPLFEQLAGCGSAQQSLRMFAVEPVRALASGYLNSPSPTKNAFLTQYYGAQWGNPAYGPSPYSDGSFVDDCADGFGVGLPIKFAFQCFAIGSSASMPAALAGGLAAANPFTISQVFSLTAPYVNATSYTLTITAPSGAQTTVPCTTSPCSTTIDGRQGQSVVVGQWFNGSTLLGQTTPLLVNPS